jgi:hypothetical protein
VRRTNRHIGGGGRRSDRAWSRDARAADHQTRFARFRSRINLRTLGHLKKKILLVTNRPHARARRITSKKSPRKSVATSRQEF